MKDQVREMDEELQKNAKATDNLELTINEKKLRIDSFYKEIKKLKFIRILVKSDFH